MNPVLVAELLKWLLGVAALVAMAVGVGAVVGAIDGHRSARALAEHREADFWRTAHEKPEPRKRA